MSDPRGTESPKMAETYFDFDSETFQITQKKRLSESSGHGGSTSGLASPFIKSYSSEDTGFETCSERSSLSQDGVLLDSPRSASPLNSSNHNFHSHLYLRSSLESLASKPVKRYDSRESIKSSSSFWDSNLSPEVKSALSKIRDQMRSSLLRVKELEEQVKQIPLLQVKNSILLEEKRQLASQLQSKTNLKKSVSYSGNINRRRSSPSADDCVFLSSENEGPRSVGVGDDSIHDVLCVKCREVQEKLLRSTYDHRKTLSSFQPSSCLATSADRDNDTIKVYQDRCTQTAATGYAGLCLPEVATLSAKSATAESSINSFCLQPQDAFQVTRQTLLDHSCDPIAIETRSIGTGPIGSFVKDACVGANKEILTLADVGVQNVVPLKDKSCNVQVKTEDIGVNVAPILISVKAGCSSSNTLAPDTVRGLSVGSQTTETVSSFVSVGVGMHSVDESLECASCAGKNDRGLSIDEILESNKSILSGSSVGVGTIAWDELRTEILEDHLASRSTATVAVSTPRIFTQTVGCGDGSITDTDCRRCHIKGPRSLGVECSPKVSETAVGDDLPLSALTVSTRTVGCGCYSITDIDCQQCLAKTSRSLGVDCTLRESDVVAGDKETLSQEDGIFMKKISTSQSVGVGECCISDNYCERCFSLQTRTIGVGNGSILDDFPNPFGMKSFSSSDEAGSMAGGSETLVEYFDIPMATENSQDHRKPALNNFDINSGEENLTERMFSEEYERITDGCPTKYTDDLLEQLSSPGEDILLTCQLLQRHFQNDGSLDENSLLVCMKNIEDYWFNCVTDTRLGKEFVSELLTLFEQNLPLLLDGLINSQDENGNTALHYLVTYGKFDCVSELLKTNLCDLNITNKAGYSAVMLGSLKEIGNAKDRIVLKRLFQKGNLKCIAQSTGQTALMLAAGTGLADTVDLLLQCGAAGSINTTDLDGSTALMCACEHGYLAVVKRLLAVDECDATIEDQDGSTAFSIAMEQNRKDIALMIYNHLQLKNTRSPKMKPIKT